MMSITHAIAGVSIGTLVLQISINEPTAIALLIIGSQLPDIDNTQSTIGRIVWPIARSIEYRWPHRSITHSLWATVVIAITSFLLCQQFQLQYWLALPLGHFIAICTDTLTPEGVQIFWPSSYWAVCGSNPNARIPTGSKGEIMLMAFFIIVLGFSIWTIDTGGIKLWFAQLLGMRDAAIQVINEKGSDKHIYLDIEGSWNADRQPLKKRFWVIEQQGNEFIIADQNGIYKTGSSNQIKANRITPQSGETAQYRVITINFDEEEISDKLGMIASSNPGALIFLSGNLSIDSPEDINQSKALLNSPKNLQILKVSGSQVILESCPIIWASQALKMQFGSGSIVAKIITPPPKL